ncbi:MAG: hypothetical protein OXU63_11075 [Acidobacteriota bacterium]|nr:hypothetical protein [Acidobacteriota bacterium]
MSDIRIRSVSDPFDDRQSLPLGIQVLTRAEAMGILGEGAIDTLDASVWKDVLARIRNAGVGRHLPAIVPQGGDEREGFVRQLQQLSDALEESPVPAAEGPRLDKLLGRDLLAGLLRVSAVSLRRYLAGERAVPDAVAARLHFLALVAGDLAGAYNDIGVRRWFDRPRSLLDGRRPAELLEAEWQPEDPGPRRVRDLARALVWSAAT